MLLYAVFYVKCVGEDENGSGPRETGYSRLPVAGPSRDGWSADILMGYYSSASVRHRKVTNVYKPVVKPSTRLGTGKSSSRISL